MSHKTGISVISQKPPNKKQRKEEIKRCKSHLQQKKKVLFNLTTKYAVVVLVQSLCRGSSVHGILQARILEWVPISFSRGSSQPRDRTQVSCIAGNLFPALPANSLPTEPTGSPQKGGRGTKSSGV